MPARRQRHICGESDQNRRFPVGPNSPCVVPLRQAVQQKRLCVPAECFRRQLFIGIQPAIILRHAFTQRQKYVAFWKLAEIRHNFQSWLNRNLFAGAQRIDLHPCFERHRIAVCKVKRTLHPGIVERKVRTLAVQFDGRIVAYSPSGFKPLHRTYGRNRRITCLFFPFSAPSGMPAFLSCLRHWSHRSLREPESGVQWHGPVCPGGAPGAPECQESCRSSVM